MKLIMPYFVIEGADKCLPIKSMPGIYRLSVDNLIKDIKEINRLGIKKVLLFGIAEEKDEYAASAYAKNGIVHKAVRAVKENVKDITVITDVCLCAYTSHGHCGVIKAQSEVVIDNKETLKILAEIAVSHAEAGADWVAPSAMAKHQVKAIRTALDNKGYRKTKILGYSAKFASNFYGPFRDAVNSAPKFGDRSGYQLNFADTKAALKEIADDIKEGADAVMVKPALSYLDVIKSAKDKFNHPLAAYNVSGEYSFVKFGAKAGFWDEKKMVFEIITAIKRAGADWIISYHAKDIAKWLKI